MDRPSQGFLNTLAIMDPLLSVHWGKWVGSWVIARKGVVGSAEIEFLRNESRRNQKKTDPDSRKRFNEVMEELTCALDGKRVILFVKDFGPHIFDTLALGDIQRYGGYSRYCDKQDAQIAAREEQREKAANGKRQDINQECFGRFGVHDFLVRKKQTELKAGVRDMRKLLGCPLDFS